jgi:hypothetical protein
VSNRTEATGNQAPLATLIIGSSASGVIGAGGQRHRGSSGPGLDGTEVPGSGGGVDHGAVGNVVPRHRGARATQCYGTPGSQIVCSSAPWYRSANNPALRGTGGRSHRGDMVPLIGIASALGAPAPRAPLRGRRRKQERPSQRREGAQRKNVMWETIAQVGRSQYTRQSEGRGVPAEPGMAGRAGPAPDGESVRQYPSKRSGQSIHLWCNRLNTILTAAVIPVITTILAAALKRRRFTRIDRLSLNRSSDFDGGSLALRDAGLRAGSDAG